MTLRLATCEQVDMNFGRPIIISDIAKMNDMKLEKLQDESELVELLRCGISSFAQ